MGKIIVTKREHLYVEDPVILARFISEIKQLAAKRMGRNLSPRTGGRHPRHEIQYTRLPT